jgi:DNA polymerase
MPGKDEDATREPFTGPAGRLLDKIWSCVGWDTNDWYITNVCLCRPYMPKGSGKENFTPGNLQRLTCRPYLLKQIELVNPNMIVTLGRIATEALIGPIRSMGSVRGKLILNNKCYSETWEGFRVFPMYHPAYLLRGVGTPQNDMYRQQTWDDVRNLKKLMEEINQ